MTIDEIADMDDVAGQEFTDGSVLTPAKDDKLTFSMKTRNAFFARVSSQLRRALPAEYAEFTARPMFNLVKVAFENDRVHYEIAFDNTKRTMEVGLHFEDGPASTIAYLSYFGRHILELKEQLGPQLEIERWTLSWGRLYEIEPLVSLERPVADRMAERLSEYITVLQPHIAAASVPVERIDREQRPRRAR